MEVETKEEKEKARLKRKSDLESLDRIAKKTKLSAEEEEEALEYNQALWLFWNEISNSKNLGPAPTEEEKEDQLSLIDALKAKYLPKRAEIEKINFGEAPIVIDPALLSPNEIHSRFKPKPGSQSISFLKSTLYENLKGKLDELKDKTVFTKGCTSFLYGEVGIGKSFGMALNILEKRSSWKECPYLIFYIHNQDENSFKELFQEFLFTLCFVEMTKKQREQMSHELRKEFQIEEDLTIQEQVEHVNLMCQCRPLIATEFDKLIRLLIFVIKKHILLVFDQAPINSQQEGKALNKIVEHFLNETRYGCSPFVFSSQLPPQKYCRDESFQQKMNRLSGKFTEEEITLYLKNNLNPIFLDGSIQDFSKPIDKIKDVSEKIPYELSRLCDCSFGIGIDSDDKVVARYYIERKNELKVSHSKVADRLRNGPWIEYLALTFLDIPFKIKAEDDKHIDENLCGFEALDEGYYTLKFHSELYYEWILEYLMKEITEWIETKGPNQIMNRPNMAMKPTTLGDLFEKYCILRLCYFACHPSQNLWTFTSFKSNLAPNDLSISFRLTNLLIFRVRSHTIGDCLQEEFEKPQSLEPCPDNIYPGTLFIPNAENFKGIDLIFMSAKQKKIFLLQYTVNIITHSSSDIELHTVLDNDSLPLPNTNCYTNLIKVICYGLKALKIIGIKEIEKQGLCHSIYLVWTS